MNIDRIIFEHEREEKRQLTGDYSQRSLKLTGGDNTPALVDITFEELFPKQAIYEESTK
tara:strand:- start:48 stop:224 length:177 start_codon:yes stop_codon:yes gene_type:complete